MLKPVSDLMIVEVWRDFQTDLVIPETDKISGRGELFLVKDIGPGFMTDTGQRIKPDIQKGDIVAIAGKILTVPYKGESYHIARVGDVIAYIRPEKGD